MEKQVKLFLEFLQNDKKVSDNTLQSYRRDIVYYNKYLDENKINSIGVHKTYEACAEKRLSNWLQHCP